MWQALSAVAVGLIGLGGVFLGQHMSRDVAHSTQRLQLEEQRRLEVRRLLVRLIVDVRSLVDQAWLLLPMMLQFKSSDWHEWVETDSGKASAERARRLQEDTVALGLLVPDGNLREALARLEVEAVRDWSEKAVAPVSNREPPEDGRDRIDVAYEHVRLCASLLRTVEREAALYLAIPPEELPASKRLRRRGKISRA